MDQVQILGELHDAQVRGVVLAEADVVDLIVDLPNGVRRTLALRGVKRFRADNFREGNTIREVSVSSGESIDSADVAYAYDLDIGAITTNKFLDSEINRLKGEGWLLIKLEPSFGCFAVCVCRAWTM